VSTELESTQPTGGLRAEYKSYESQKCFVGHSHEAEWRDDILSACAEVLPKFGLEPWYAADHFDPTKPLRDKVVELIANARYGIYDLSSWQDKNGEWYLPRNVWIELGMAIALNRPALLLRHTSNEVLPLPACLQGVELLEFAGETTLKKALGERLPRWLDAPPDRDWLNRFCIFGNRVCNFREEHPRARQWGHGTLRCHVSDGLDNDHPCFQMAEREEIRGAFEDVFSRYSDLELDYLDELSLVDGYQFLLCSHCQVVRSTPFAVYRVLPHAPAGVFIAIGMSIAIETLFEYDIPKIILVHQEQDLPSLLRGYEVVEAISSTEVKRKLKAFVPAVTQKVRETAWKPRLLPFVEFVRVVDMAPRITEESEPTSVETGILLDASSGKVWIAGRPVYPDLTNLEFTLLSYLLRRRGEICSRGELLEALYPEEPRDSKFDMADNRVDTLIARLQDKIELDRRRPKYILTVRGRGRGFMLAKAIDEPDRRVPEGKDIRLDGKSGKVWVEGRAVSPGLTAVEFALLSHLLYRRGKICSESELEALYPGGSQDVYTLMGQLRRKIESDPRRPKYILTVRGRGFMLAKAIDEQGDILEETGEADLSLPYCLVVIPFASEFWPVFESIRATIENSTHYRCLRADSIVSTDTISKRVQWIIDSADLVIADISGNNPNVMMEVETAKEAGKPLVIISQSSENVPFDMRSFPYIAYIPTKDGLAALQNNLVKVLNETLHLRGAIDISSVHPQTLVATLGLTIEQVLESGELPSNVPTDYPHLCDWLEEDLRRRLHDSIGDFQYPEASKRDGEILSVRIAFRWQQQDGQPDFGDLGWWSLLELAPFEEVYPEQDAADFWAR